MFEDFYDKVYDLLEEDIQGLMKLDNGSIGNVIRGLHKESYGILSPDNNVTNLSFFYINYDGDVPGQLLKLELGEKDFYYYLLGFSMLLAKDYNLIDPLNIYFSFIGYLRTILENNGIYTITTKELNELPQSYEIISTSRVEIIKTFSKEEFYKNWLNVKEDFQIKVNTSYLYLMLNKDTGYFKIGQSINPQFRERTLQSQEPEIVLLKIWECAKQVEKDLHQHFRSKRIRGEWFKLNIKDLSEIDPFVKNYLSKDLNNCK